MVAFVPADKRVQQDFKEANLRESELKSEAARTLVELAAGGREWVEMVLPSGERFRAEFRLNLLPKHERLLMEYSHEGRTLDEYYDAMAEVIAYMSVNPDHDKEFWLTFNEETGYLKALLSYLVGKSGEAKPNIRSFR